MLKTSSEGSESFRGDNRKLLLLLNAHINETGLNSFTGKPATEGEKLVAKHYGWVKSSSTIGAMVIDGVLDYSDLSAYFLTKGKIPSAVYDGIRIRSIHNPKCFISYSSLAFLFEKTFLVF